LVAALVMGVVLALVVPLTATAGPSRGSAAPAGSGGPQVTWAACGPQLECASVPVPLDWARPNGPRIALAVARHLASRPEQRIGSLFVDPGGPGDSGVAMVAERGEALDAMTGGRGDVVGWDIRGGAGASAPVSCFADAGERANFWDGLPVPTTRAEQRRYLAKTIELAQRCGTRNGVLAHISTADTARDLDHLRQVVGDRQLSYFGESYGTLIGQTYANLFPRRVRAMALDGVVDPVPVVAGTEAVLARSLADTDRVFRRFLALCEAAGPDRCALAGHGPVAARVYRLLDRLRQGPLPAPSATPPGELTYGEALTALKFEGLPKPAQWPLAAVVLEAAIQGDGSAIEDIAAGATSDQARMLLQEQGTALICADSPAHHPASAWPRVVDRLEAVSRVGGPVLGWINASCASWPPPAPTATPAPGTLPPGIRSWSSAPASTPTRRSATPGAWPGGSATRSCWSTTATATSAAGTRAPASSRPPAATWSTSRPRRQGRSARRTASPSTPPSANPPPSRSRPRLVRVAGSGEESGHTAGMATGEEPIRVGSRRPFDVPPDRRDPARRLRGRLVAPVTVWTAGQPPGGAGLTVSSVLVAEGRPARLLGLIDPTSAFWEAARETRAFVVHVLAAGDRALAERFSEVRPPIRGPFDRLEVAESPWGPVLGGRRPRAACRLAGSTPVGYAELVEGVIEQLELPDLEDPLAYLHGSYRSVTDLPDHG
jgi:pimeloyl-ACP methyl ester carboxylesterase/flavin reductase (DIM6/NTAB) family NADH-FMN oxidoreductase RutF